MLRILSYIAFEIYREFGFYVGIEYLIEPIKENCKLEAICKLGELFSGYSDPSRQHSLDAE